MIEGILNTRPRLQPNFKINTAFLTGPVTITVYSFILFLLGLLGGQYGYLLIAIMQLMVIIILYRYAPLSGILWIIAFSSTTGLFQRLTLYSSGAYPQPDSIRFALEIGILIYFIKFLLTQQPAQTRITLRIDLAVWSYLILSTLYTFNLFYTIPAVTIWGWRWVCIPILLYFVGRLIGQEQANVRRIYQILIIILLIQAAYGAYQSIIGIPFYEQPWVANLLTQESSAAYIEGSKFLAGKPRIPALTEGHTSGGFLIPYLLLWIFFLPADMLDKHYRRLRWVAIAMGLLFLLFSNERSAIGMATIGIIVGVVLKLRRKTGRGIYLLIIPGMLLLVFLMSLIDPAQIPWQEDTILLRRLLELTNPFRSGTLAGRLTEYWPILWELFVANPLGYGLGTFHDTSANMAYLQRVGFAPHNMYLQIALEVGLIGLLSYMLIITLFMRMVYRFNNLRLHIEQTYIMPSVLSSFIAFLAIGVANHPIETFPLAVLFWFLMGVVVSHLNVAWKQYR
ncbi:MAG: O-antigen ligase domain-containing protein [Caldilinea sp. CFX5]|nr:O-antigen ligase domain-containing protein [Caldilinea sp. CFX5]